MKKFKYDESYDSYVLRYRDRCIIIDGYRDVQDSYIFFYNCTLKRHTHKLNNIALFALNNFKSVSVYLNAKGSNKILKKYS